MKKLLIPIFSLIFVACGVPLEHTTETTQLSDIEDEKPKEEEKKQEESEPKDCNFIYDSENTTIEFGAFKTTEKVEVKGAFESFDILNTSTGKTPEEVFNEASFEIFINSLETNNTGRNQRIRDEFFKKLTATQSIKGKVIGFENDKIKINLTMNDIDKVVFLDSEVKDNNIMLSGTINVLDWSADKALESLNEACYDLHKGADGVSKTWADVNLYISSELEEKCN